MITVISEKPISKEINASCMKPGDCIRITQGINGYTKEGTTLLRTFKEYVLLENPSHTWPILSNVWGIPVDLEVKVIEK